MTESPRTLKQGNLTGVPRKIKDSCADMHNLVQGWNKHLIRGTLILQEIAKVKLEAKCKEPPLNLYPDELLPLTNQLQAVYEELVEVLNQMKKIASQFEVLLELCKSENPQFQTWPTEKFVELVSEIARSYEKELGVKFNVKNDFAHQSDNKILTFLTSLWTYQVFIPDTNDLLMESMLLETGLR